MLRHLLKLRVTLLGLALIAAALGVGNAFVALFVPARYELTYPFSLSVHHCIEGRCAYSAMFEIANSRRGLQEEVQVTLRGIPKAAGGSPRSMAIGRWLTARPERPGTIVGVRPLFTVVRGG